jgi:cyclophilin family peptidyl-prolyl cis-trans isomerase
MKHFTFACILSLAALAPLGAQRRAAAPPASSDPTMVIETAKGTIDIRLFRADAPVSVQHIIDLVNRSFYRAQRFHRVERSLVQFGDPGSRNMTLINSWGTGNSGRPIGVAEFNKHRHVRGAVGLAHGGNPKFADSQLYIMKTANPALDGKHVVVGQVTSGMAVVDRLEKADVLKLVTIKEAGRK